MANSFSWNTGSGDWAVAANWTDLTSATPGPPTAADDATINSAGIITGTGTTGLLRLHGNSAYQLSNVTLTLAGLPNPPFGTTTLFFGNSSTVTIAGGMIDGSAGAFSLFDDGALIANGGATITAQGLGVGTVPGSDVNLTVAGLNTVWQNTGNSGATAFINAGGTVTVTDSAKMNNGAGFIVGSNNGDNGLLIVSAQGQLGTGSLTAGGSAGSRGNVNVDAGTVVATSNIAIGNNGAGTLTIGNGGIFESAGGPSSIGANAGSAGSLIIRSGGQLRFTAPTQTPTTVLFIGRGGSTSTLPGADGVALVTGAGSVLDTGGNALAIGNNAGATGSLLVEQGGVVKAGSSDANQLYALAVANSGGTGNLTLTDVGSTMTVDGFALIGRGGAASLTIQNGATLDVNNAGTNGGGAQIGFGRGAGPSSPPNVGGSGAAKVTTGGVLDASDSSAGVAVGGNGVTGALSVFNGGTVLTGGLTVGSATTASGTLYIGSGVLNVGAAGIIQGTGTPQTTSYNFVIGSANASIGPTNAATGSALISGAGAKLDTNGNGLAIGLLSNGDMVVSKGGNVIVGTPDGQLLSALAIGRLGNGSLTIADPGSVFTVNGGAYVGRGGAGGLTIENHGTLQILLDGLDNGYFDIGNASLTNGNTLVSGGTGHVFVTTNGSLYSKAAVTVGRGGNEGSLTVNNGGTVEVDQKLMIGTTVVIPDGGANITTGGTTSISGATAMPSTGVVTVGTGGLLKIDGSGLNGAASLSVGTDLGSSGALNIAGSGARLQSSGSLLVGDAGLGTLLIQGGGTVITSPAIGGLAGADIAAHAGSDGSSVSVIGAGSNWQIGGALLIGDAAHGLLSIAADGDVFATSADIGVQAGASGIVSVVGNGSNLTLSGSLIVGDAASAELSILNGATVSAANGDIGLGASATGNVDLEGTGSHLKIDNDLNIGGAGVGVLTLGNGTELTVVNFLNIGASGLLNSQGGIIDPAVVNNTGRAGGKGQISASVSIVNSGTLFAASGTETLIAPIITGKGVLEIDPGGNLVVNVGSVVTTQTVTFTDGSGILTIGTLGGFAATIGSYLEGDTIMVPGTTIATTHFDSGTHVLTLFDASSNVAGTLQFGSSITNGSSIVVNGVAPCFVAGTRIGTERGEVCVEDLEVGDVVQVAWPPPLTPQGEGKVPGRVIWLGHRTVDCTRHPDPRKVWPVRVAAHAFGIGRPCRDLWLSPDHALYIGDVLIPVKHLINGTSIVQVPCDEVTYYHVELPKHSVLLAEGLAAESYLDTGDRTNFANAGGPVTLYPDFSSRQWDAGACAPLVVTGPALDIARRWVNSLAVGSTRAA